MKKFILPIFFYAAVVGIVFGKALFPGPNQLIFGDDIHHQYYFYRQFFNSFLQEGIFPWWNPYNFSGTPFIANPIANIWYPPTWLFTILPLNLAYSWHLALHILWAMVGMWFLISNFKFQISNFESKEKNLFDIGAFVGGLLFGLSGFFMARVWAGHVDVVAAASWMPLVAISNIKYQISNRKKDAVIAAVILAMQILAGYQTMALFTLEAVGLMSLFLCFKNRSLLPALRALLVLLLAVGLAAIQLVPLFEFLSQSIRTIPKPYEWASYGSLTWESLKQLLSPFFFGNQITYSGPPPNFIEHAAFIGRVGLLLALGGALKFRHTVRFLLIAVLGLWISLGPHAPIDIHNILWNTVPVYQSLRIPPRHLVLFVFGAAVLASFGLRLVKVRALQLIISVILFAEMVGFARQFVELRPIPQAREDRELIALLKKDTQPYRILQNFGVWIPQREALEFDATMAHRIFSATGYDVAILKNYYEFIDAAAGNKTTSILTHDVQVPYFNGNTKALDALNIKYIMVPRTYDQFVGMKLLREDPIRDYRLYENTTVLPRFYFPDGTGVTMKKYTPNEIILATNNLRDATLMSSEIYYPGWEAFIDGKKTDIIKGNHAFRTLFVPAGNHDVRFHYRPTTFLIGVLINVITVIGVLVWVKFARES